MKIFILILICILSLGTSVYFIQKILKDESFVVHGPYVCEGKNISIMQNISNDMFAGGTLTKNISISYQGNFFNYLIYPPNYQKKDYLRDNTSMGLDLDQEHVSNILNDYGIGGPHLEELISDSHIDNDVFLDFGKCFNVHAREIYTDIAKRQKVDGDRFSYSIFSKVYNRK
jgi:hypothetical protein